jgi:hypothetical protein
LVTIAPDRVVAKYLARYAEALAQTDFPKMSAAESALVVPAYGESPAVLEHLIGRGGVGDDPAGSSRLLILVVNQPQGAPVEKVERNRELVRKIHDRYASVVRSTSGPLHFFSAPSPTTPALLLADLSGEPLDPKEGVGRARKLGFDLALRLFREGLLGCPYVGSADADVTLPPEYGASLQKIAAEEARLPRPAPALLFPDRHVPGADEALGLHMSRVEMTFRYYVLGLAQANSPYAYHSLGSALAVSLPHYAQVRGVPPRAAGEDFYLLSKLAQVGPLRRLRSPTVPIETRISDRVPFGTGPSLQRATEAGEDFLAYNPDSFRWLHSFLARLVENVRRETPQGITGLFSRDKNLPLWVQDFAESFWRSLEGPLAECPTPAHRLRRFHERFDALRTLQFIHEAHRQGLPLLPIEEATWRAGLTQKGIPPAELLHVLQEREEALPAYIGPHAGVAY